MQPKLAQSPLERDDTRLDVLQYLRVVWRRKLMVFLPVVFITSMTAVGVRFMSPLYVSRARLHIEPRTRVNSELERRIVDEDTRVRRKDQLAEVRTQFTNRDFLERVVRELGLHNDPTILANAKLVHDTRTPDVPTEEIAMRMLTRGLRSKLTVRAAEANMFNLEVSDNDAESAYILAKVIARSFVTEVKRGRMEKLEELFKFSTQQSRLYRDKLEAAEKELREFQSQLIRDQNSSSAINATNITPAKAQLRRMDLDIEQTERRLENLRGVLAQTFDPLPDTRSMRADREAAGLDRRLRGIMENEVMSDIEGSSATGTTTPGADLSGPTRTALRRRLNEVADQKYASAEPFYRDKIADYAFEMMNLEAQRAGTTSLKNMIDRYSSKAERQPEKELQLRSLQEAALAARNNFDTFERSLQSAELSETIMATQLAGGVEIVDPAEKPSAPIKPNKQRLVILALLLSLAGGLGTVFCLEYLDKSFKNIEEIERWVGIHVVGTVPRVATGMPFGGMPVNHKRNWMVASSLVLLVAALGGMVLYERLLRKQHVMVPHTRAQEILNSEPSAAPASATKATTTPASATKATSAPAGATKAKTAPAKAR